MELKKAYIIASELVMKLQAHCQPNRCHIAGAIRRERHEVSDIDIVCQPLTNSLPDLFGNPGREERTIQFTTQVKLFGRTIKGDVNHGRYVQIELPEGIMLDLFMPEQADYFRQLTIRTGSREYVQIEIARTWRRSGWCGTEQGLRRVEDCVEIIEKNGKVKWICFNKNPKLHPVTRTV